MIHINRGTNRYYFARYRNRGDRKFQVIKRHFKTKEQAARALLKEFFRNQFAKIGEVCMASDYYPPLPLLEIRKP